MDPRNKEAKTKKSPAAYSMGCYKANNEKVVRSKSKQKNSYKRSSVPKRKITKINAVSFKDI